MPWSASCFRSPSWLSFLTLSRPCFFFHSFSRVPCLHPHFLHLKPLTLFLACLTGLQEIIKIIFMSQECTLWRQSYLASWNTQHLHKYMHLDFQSFWVSPFLWSQEPIPGKNASLEPSIHKTVIFIFLPSAKLGLGKHWDIAPEPFLHSI